MTGAVLHTASHAVLDHLVVAARTLDEGAAWCEATLGVAPVAGGRHVGRGTHNRLLALAGGRVSRRSYLEIIAVDPDAPDPEQPRWFDLDDAAIRRALESRGPQLVHWVATTVDIDAASTALRRAGFEPGPVVAASRMAAGGLLSWRITIRDDGRRPGAGAIPLLIEWGAVHPCDALVPSPVSVAQLVLGGVDSQVAAMLGADCDPSDAAAPLAVSLSTPLGPVVLTAPRAAGSTPVSS